MLEFSLPGGGLKGITLVGTLIALRDRKIIPDIVTGISAGAYAGYMTYSGMNRQKILKWFALSRNHFYKRSLSWYLPPYDVQGEYVKKMSRPYLVERADFDRYGIRKFYVGYTTLPRFKFESVDILDNYCKHQAYEKVMKSSLVPFVTHYAPHFEGAIDGSFRRLFFASPEEPKERWLFTLGDLYIFRNHSKEFDRVIRLDTKIKSLTRARTSDLIDEFDIGYEQGLKITA
ncbi:patatin-like phospholipase family protein [Pseudobacteriovorax antillogorgiicola]|uniref:Patatin-like phospholipase n=1 Tax=Pseudobacteriovorax antillogorgiicola TaxID=1513793 RepID=A0A1Y6CNT5_9BACT|nr:patatin-like phospholipase family protein [Pseudobacteriovorax antillogorgiicola]TCS44790.1 patatin-like phospholipase [Pseudobacteriovorax antillogorgiicola]SMF77437.1 Patatin-like phospholipase [Pseudobacteriovorax antillogorgiicola]